MSLLCRALFRTRPVLSRPFDVVGGRVARCLLTSSYVEGPFTPPLSFHTLPSYFEEVLLKKYADRDALIARQERPRTYGGPRPAQHGTQARRSDCLAWSFAEFDLHIHALARGLVQMGVRKGDRVGVVMGNNRSAPLICVRKGNY